MRSSLPFGVLLSNTFVRGHRVLDPESLDDRLRDFARRVLPLAGDQAAVANHEGLERPPWTLASRSLSESSTRQGMIFLASEAVAVLLLDVGEAGDGLAVDEVGALGELDVDDGGGAVAVGGRRLLRLEELRDRLLEVCVVAEVNIGDWPPVVPTAAWPGRCSSSRRGQRAEREIERATGALAERR
jgi:hypothetical protein